MNEKVWIIEDPDEQRPLPASVPPGQPGAKRRNNPAVAYSLSLVLWGAGQCYNGQRALGILFFLLMVNLVLYVAVLSLLWEPVMELSGKGGVTATELLWSSFVLFLAGFITWSSHAVHAYYRALRGLRDPFGGVRGPLLPMLCSLVVPGWGQFLNGQPKKGMVFQLFLLPVMVALPGIALIIRLWPMVGSGLTVHVMEWIIGVCIMLVPLSLLFWLMSVFDALKVSVDAVKKESLRKRMGYTANRIRMQGFIRGVIPQVRLTLVLLFMLSGSIGMFVAYAPKDGMLHGMERARDAMRAQKMKVLPDLVQQMIHAVARRD